MKTSTTLVSMILIAGLMQACGAYNKSPVEGLQDLKANAQRENDTRNLDVPQTVTKYNDREVPKEVRVEVPVYKNVTNTVVKEQATLTGDAFTITTDDSLDFVEGKASAYKIRVRSFVTDVKLALKSDNLPAGAKIEADKSEAGLYTLSWTPAFNTVATNTGRKIMKVKLGLEVVSAPSEEVKKQVSAITKQKEVSLVVWTDQTLPSDLKVEGLSNQVAEGTVTPFMVTVKVPGLDGSSAQKPALDVTYDGVSFTPGNNFHEQNGARYVQNIAAKYLGDSKWQFAGSFDTKTISVERQIGTDGAPIMNADGLRVRLSLKVRSPLGTATPEQLVLMKITYVNSGEVSAPVFDMQSLGGSGLKAAPGDTLSGMILVSSQNIHNDVSVEVPNLTGISGSPKISCIASTVGKHIQLCTLTWSVPCNAKAGDLTQKITLTAQSVSGGQKSAPAKQEITVTPSSAQNAKCATAAPAPAKPAAKKAGK